MKLPDLVHGGALRRLLATTTAEAATTVREPLPAPRASDRPRNEGHRRIAEIASRLSRAESPLAEVEWFEERAAILQFEAGLSRADAEQAAATSTMARYPDGVMALLLPLLGPR